MNNLPILEKFQLDVDQYNELTLRVENLVEESQIDLGPIYDEDGDAVSVESILLPALFNYDPDQAILEFDYDNLMATALGALEVTYEVKLILTDEQ